MSEPHKEWAIDAEPELRRIIREQADIIKSLQSELRKTRAEVRALRGEGVVAMPKRKQA